MVSFYEHWRVVSAEPLWVDDMLTLLWITGLCGILHFYVFNAFSIFPSTSKWDNLSFGRCIRVRLNTNLAREDYEVQDQMTPNVNYNLFQNMAGWSFNLHTQLNIANWTTMVCINCLILYFVFKIYHQSSRQDHWTKNKGLLYCRIFSWSQKVQEISGSFYY